jgi:hypothetical protein
MSKKKGQMSKYCRIFQWVEAQDPSFAGAIRDLCLEGALFPGRRSAGVTFLYPKDKAHREEIVDKTYSDAADEAVRLVEALIIPDALHVGADFTKRDVGSRLGVRFTVESADAAKVKLADGVELARADDFQPLTRRNSDLAVWLIVKGRPPLKGEPYRPPMREKQMKTGGIGRPIHGGGNAERLHLAARVEAEYDWCMKKDRCRSYDPYLAKTVSLLNFLKMSHPDLYMTVLPVLDYEPFVTFYLLLEPFKTAGEPLLPDSALFGTGAWNGVNMYTDAAREYRAVFADLPAQGDPSASDPQAGGATVPYVFRDRAAIAAQIDAVRKQIGTQNPRQALPALLEAYATLAAQNSIHGMGPVLPDATQAALADGKKLWQDEFRFTIYAALRTVRGMPAYTSDLLASILRDIRTVWPGNDYTKELRLLNQELLKGNVAPRTELLLLMKFLNSTDFLYLPAAPDMVGPAWGDPDDPTDYRIYNRNAAALAALSRVAGMQHSAGVSQRALQELRLYAQAHGGLPPEVLALASKPPEQPPS